MKPLSTMPAPEFWTYAQGVSTIMPIQKGIMLGITRHGRFEPIAPARAVFGEGSYRWNGLRKLTQARAERLWSAWLRNDCVPLSEDEVLGIRLEEILTGASQG